MPPLPIYRRPRPVPWDAAKLLASTTAFIDLREIHLPSFGPSSTVEEAARRFDGRAAAAVSAAVGLEEGVVLGPAGGEAALLEEKYAGTDEALTIPTAKCLAVLAYPDYFPDADVGAHVALVSRAIETARSGWCGSFGPDGEGTFDAITKHDEGNYDMSQMHLVRIAYRYHDRLTSAALDHLVEVLLPGGRIRRPNEEDELTSGGAPVDWSRAGVIEVPIPIVGFVFHPKIKRIGETENHILTIHTARYLANQLLYQRDHHPAHDNRRNGFKGAPTCTSLMLSLLRNILRDDFSEYNAKNYQNEVRSALLNLCDFAYDHEVRLAARMVLDYVSAHVAVSSNDLRRLVPFRRRNEDQHVTRSHGHMEVGLLSMTTGADPLTQRFAILAGNTRAYETHADPREPGWTIKTNEGDGNQAAFDALSDYRLPPSIHDLFMTDRHRRFFQRLHRTPQDDEDVTGRNCDNHEIYAGSPSYLITAGGSPATHAVDAKVLGIVFGDQTQQLGVALPTSFMPTGTRAGPPNPKLSPTATFHEKAADQIQISSFSDRPGEMENYGVAPDFLCGTRLHAPRWCVRPRNGDNDHFGRFRFVNQGDGANGPGFFLAIYDDGVCVAIEAFDTWLHDDVPFEEFRAGVVRRNGGLRLLLDEEAEYTTHNGTRIRFVIWDRPEDSGARIVSITHGPGDPADAEGGAGTDTAPFLRGTVMNSRGDGVVEIRNRSLGTTLVLDMSDPDHPRRTGETGAVEAAGSREEVWVDFAWNGPTEGDFFRPFNTLAAAAAAVADGGVVKVVPGTTSERPTLGKGRRMRIVAPMGAVVFGAR